MSGGPNKRGGSEIPSEKISEDAYSVPKSR